MDSRDHHINPQQSPEVKSHGAHVCTKCGWNYPNPHPSAKNRRAHKKICGTIKGYELFETEKAKQNLDFLEEHCLDNEQNAPSKDSCAFWIEKDPSVVEKGDERIEELSEEDVFADAVCEFSCGIVSDSFQEKEETATNREAKGIKNPCETQKCNSLSTGYVVKSSEVAQESCEVQPVEVLENFDVSSSVEAASGNQKGGNSSTEAHFMASETLNESSKEVKVIDGGDTVSDVVFETEFKGNIHITHKSNLPDGSESKLEPALEKTEESSDVMWNDEVIYSDLEGPHASTLEAMSMIHPGEADSIVSENDLVISTSQSVLDDTRVEDTDVALHETKGFEELESSHSVNPFLHETSKGDNWEADTLNLVENLGIQCEDPCAGTEVPSSEKPLFKEKIEPQSQTDMVAVTEFPIAENKMTSKIDPEDIKMKAEESESSFVAAQKTVESETLGVSLPGVDRIVPDPNAGVSHAANKASEVDLTGHESELIQEHVAEENILNRKLSSESSCDVENYVSSVYVVLKGDDTSDQQNNSTETSKHSILEIGAEDYKSIDEARGESSRGGLVEESSFIHVKQTKYNPISHSGSEGTPLDNTAQTANQKLLESGRTEFNRVVGGLGVIQGNEIDINAKAQNFYSEVPVTIQSNDRRDFGRLQNLSETHIRSLISSPLVTRDKTSHAFESNLGSVSGLRGGVDKLENASEITMVKTTSWSTVKEQHVPLKNLLNEARSPRLQQEAKNHHESTNIPRVSSILGPDNSPEDARWPERREVSEEWNSPAKYPVDLKRDDRKVKGRPFWVPFVCCSSVN